jgi:hypothetical protein
VKHCSVSIVGEDGQHHTLTLEAKSLFDAAASGLHQWAQYWWFDRKANVTVEVDGQRWQVDQDRIRKWQAAGARSAV